MKNARKLISAVMALTMVGAFAPMSVFADGENTKTLDSTKSSDTVTATYEAQPSYTVTIPASAKIADDAQNAVAQSITAENVLLDKGKQLVVTLTKAENTSGENADTFNAKNGDSTVTYNILKEGKNITLGSNVAEFVTMAGEKTVALKFVKTANSTPTVAGTYSEALTFSIAVENAEPAETVVDLSKLTGAYIAKDGDVLTGTLGANVKVSIADGAAVTLRGVTINGTDDGAYKWAGITAEGNATILLEGTNTVKGFDSGYPGIYVPSYSTLYINGSGSLDASSNGSGAGIGSGNSESCGSIVIFDGTITATGGLYAAGIGSGAVASCGAITIGGGTVTANGGIGGAGIGSGYTASCGAITINGGTVTAKGGDNAAGIGGGHAGSCEDITIADTITAITATKGANAPCSIGAGNESPFIGKVTIFDKEYPDGCIDNFEHGPDVEDP